MLDHSIKTIINQYKNSDLSITGLEYEILIATAINKPRSFIFSHPDYQLSTSEHKQFEQLLNRKKLGEPIAYITGKKEFWSLELNVDKNVLIPRPETELLVETCINACKDAQSPSILELGIGSGAISIALKQEIPNATIYATDISYATLEIAKKNAAQYHVHAIHFINANWLNALIKKNSFDIIISNPPYIANNDPHLAQNGLQFEPPQALISGKDGLSAIQKIITSAPNVLKPGGKLLLEHGYHQQAEIILLMQSNGFSSIQTLNDLNQVPRVIMAKIK